MDGNNPTPPNGKSSRLTLWLKRMGVAGFLFLLFKGIAWLVVLGAAGKCALG